jgi:Uma2 family endonuclease
MAMPARVADLDWTVERALALPDDGNRYEVLDGELFVTPAPTWGHQAALGELFARVREYARAHGVGVTMTSPADITFSPKRLVQPDFFVVPPRLDGPYSGWADVKSLVLAVEVLSPSTARADRYRKRAIYLSEDVGEYWIVDAGQRLIERWRPGASEPDVITDELVWAPREGVPPFSLSVAAYFDEVTAYGFK